MVIRLLLALLLLVHLPATPSRAAEGATERYKALLEAAQQGDKPVDWQSLRFAYADSEGFDLMGVAAMAHQEAMFKAFQAGDWPAVLEKAQTILKTTFVSIDAHVMSDIAYRQLGEPAKAETHFRAAKGLIDSIRTGDGRSPETAWSVIAVWEEYSIMRILGLQPSKQSLIQTNGHSYDAMEVVDEKGKAFTLYFLIDRVLAAQAKLLGTPDKKP